MVALINVDIVKNLEDNSKLLIGLIIGIICLFALVIPFKLIMTEDELAPISQSEKSTFMRRV